MRDGRAQKTRRWRRHCVTPTGSRRGEHSSEPETAPEDAWRWTGEIDPFLGLSPCIRHLEIAATKVLDAGQPLLIYGETGTGKGVLARWFHQAGPRGGEAFVDVGCAGVDPEALAAELFGYEGRSIGGLSATKAGLFEIADRGFVFLDEVGEIPLPIQDRILRLLDERCACRDGGDTLHRTDVHLVMASHEDLDTLFARFRAELWERFLPLRIPPLRERPEDVPSLAVNLLSRLAAELPVTPTLSRDAVARLQAHSWPGNVRELKNVLERALLLGSSPELSAQDLHFDSFEPVVRQG